MIKSLLVSSAAAIGLLTLVPNSFAQIIAWDAPQNISGDTDVSKAGTYLDAATFWGLGVTVNTVNFKGLSSLEGEPYSDGAHITITAPGGTGGTFFNTGPGFSSDYVTLNSTFGQSSEVAGQVTITGLTTGQTYQVQAFSYNSNDDDQTTYSGTTPVTLDTQLGQYAIGTFVATSDKETFNYSGSRHSILDAVSVRDVAAAPEPSTDAMIGLGLLSFFAFRKVRHPAA